MPRAAVLQRACREGRRWSEPRALARVPGAYATRFALARGARRMHVVLSRRELELWTAPSGPDGTVGERSPLLRADADERDAVWLDDGSLVLHSNRGGWWSLHRAHPGSRQVERIVDASEHATDPDVDGEGPCRSSSCPTAAAAPPSRSKARRHRRARPRRRPLRRARAHRTPRPAFPPCSPRPLVELDDPAPPSPSSATTLPAPCLRGDLVDIAASRPTEPSSPSSAPALAVIDEATGAVLASTVTPNLDQGPRIAASEMHVPSDVYRLHLDLPLRNP